MSYKLSNLSPILNNSDVVEKKVFSGKASYKYVQIKTNKDVAIAL